MLKYFKLRKSLFSKSKRSISSRQSAKNRRFTAFYCFTPATGTTGTGSYRPFS